MGFTLIGGIGATLVWGKFRPDEKEAAFVIAEAGWLERTREDLPPPKEHPFTESVPSILRPGPIAAILVVSPAIILFTWFW